MKAGRHENHVSPEPGPRQPATRYCRWRCSVRGARRDPSQQRGSACSGAADKLVYCHETLHLEKEMVDAGWEPDAARWESDCESGNESETPNDFADEQELQLDTEEILSLCA